VDYAVGTRDLKETGGLAKVMPVTAKTNLVASMAIAGIPPFNGFFSKLLIIIACIQKGHLGYGICAVAASILTLASFMKVQKFAFLGELKNKFKDIKEVPVTMRFSMITLAVICVVSGLLLLPLFRPFLQSAADVLLLGSGYKDAVFSALR
jgi:multicomponent Na+:H+ antiporter subunit D